MVLEMFFFSCAVALVGHSSELPRKLTSAPASTGNTSSHSGAKSISA